MLKTAAILNDMLKSMRFLLATMAPDTKASMCRALANTKPNTHKMLKKLLEDEAGELDKENIREMSRKVIRSN
jgi:hypothetical protein